MLTVFVTVTVDTAAAVAPVASKLESAPVMLAVSTVETGVATELMSVTDADGVTNEVVAPIAVTALLASAWSAFRDVFGPTATTSVCPSMTVVRTTDPSASVPGNGARALYRRFGLDCGLLCSTTTQLPNPPAVLSETRHFRLLLPPLQSPRSWKNSFSEAEFSVGL